MFRSVLPLLLHALFVFQVKGQKNIPKGENFILISNHLSWLDSFAIAASFPPEPRVYFMGDPHRLQGRRLPWAIASRLGYIPVNSRDRSSPGRFHYVNQCLQRGGILVIYPEGPYGSSEGGLNELKKGFAHFAFQNIVPVLPVGLSGTKELWLRKKIRVFIGAPITTHGYTVDELVAEGRARLVALIPEYHESRGPKLLRSWLTNLPGTSRLQ